MRPGVGRCHATPAMSDPVMEEILPRLAQTAADIAAAIRGQGEAVLVRRPDALSSDLEGYERLPRATGWEKCALTTREK